MFYVCVNDWDMSEQFYGTYDECLEYVEYYFELSGVTLSIWEAGDYYDR